MIQQLFSITFVVVVVAAATELIHPVMRNLWVTGG